MTDLQRLPNLAALRAFEAAARHENFSRAADEIHLTHGAISHQIRALEEDLGVQLFSRNGKRIAITAEGERFAAIVRKSLSEIANAAAELKSVSKMKRLTISALPSFAARWLAMRLGKFIDKHPDFEVTLQSSTQLVDLNRGDVDVGIRFGSGSYPGINLEFLMGDYYYPVASPRYRGGNLPKTPQELQDNMLLRSDRDEPWSVWFTAAGLDMAEPTGGLVFTDSSMLILSAAEGNGIAMARHVIAMQEISAGELVRLFDIAVPCQHAYYLAYTRTGIQKPQVRAFRDWLLEEVAQFKKSMVWPEGGEPLQYRLAPNATVTEPPSP
jgi:LysR family glycine cleavage system transcriptional activator